MDQLLQTSPVSAERSFEDPNEALINSSVYPPVQVNTPGTTVPVADVTGKETVTSSAASVPEADSTPENTETDVSTDRRYPTRERRSPVRLSY